MGKTHLATIVTAESTEWSGVLVLNNGGNILDAKRKEEPMETNNKLREACANIAEYARSAMCHTTDAHVLGYLNQIEGWAKAALAEPVKNCEVGTAEEQSERFYEWCSVHRSPNCPAKRCRLCILRWAQMPYEKEGGAK